jgi:hypothetical protein
MLQKMAKATVWSTTFLDNTLVFERVVNFGASFGATNNVKKDRRWHFLQSDE